MHSSSETVESMHNDAACENMSCEGDHNHQRHAAEQHEGREKDQFRERLQAHPLHTRALSFEFAHAPE